MSSRRRFLLTGLHPVPRYGLTVPRMELETSTPPGPAPVPWVAVEACTLPTAEQPLRVAEFDDLFTHALRVVECPHATAEQARLVLRGDEALAGRVQQLADAETACCSFFTFALTPLDGDESGTSCSHWTSRCRPTTRTSWPRSSSGPSGSSGRRHEPPPPRGRR
jgi:hypothetical protein